MKRSCFLRGEIVALLCAALIVPQTVLAAASSPAEVTAVSDVALGPGGTLTGQVVDAQGLGIPRAAVAIRQSDADVARTVADQAGYFQVAGLRPGAYEVASADGQGAFRLWAANAAPPVARPSALVVAGQPIVRGNGIGWGKWVLPAVAAGGIITGVAIAASEDNHHRRPASP